MLRSTLPFLAPACRTCGGSLVGIPVPYYPAEDGECGECRLAADEHRRATRDFLRRRRYPRSSVWGGLLALLLAALPAGAQPLEPHQTAAVRRAESLLRSHGLGGTLTGATGWKAQRFVSPSPCATGWSWREWTDFWWRECPQTRVPIVRLDAAGGLATVTTSRPHGFVEASPGTRKATLVLAGVSSTGISNGPHTATLAGPSTFAVAAPVPLRASMVLQGAEAWDQHERYRCHQLATETGQLHNSILRSFQVELMRASPLLSPYVCGPRTIDARMNVGERAWAGIITQWRGESTPPPPTGGCDLGGWTAAPVSRETCRFFRDADFHPACCATLSTQARSCVRRPECFLGEEPPPELPCDGGAPDGACTPREEAAGSCPEDCFPEPCGDGVCDFAERQAGTWCALDCGEQPSPPTTTCEPPPEITSRLAELENALAALLRAWEQWVATVDDNSLPPEH